MTYGRKRVSDNKEWNTPPKFIPAINELFDYDISLDPCSNPYSHILSKIQYILPTNGLEESWNYKNIYVNPPYGKTETSNLKMWIKKGFEAYKNGSNVLFLIPVSTSSKHFKDYIFQVEGGICFISDYRVKFWLNGEECKRGAPMACCFVYMGKEYNKFERLFTQFGKTLKIN